MAKVKRNPAQNRTIECKICGKAVKDTTELTTHQRFAHGKEKEIEIKNKQIIKSIIAINNEVDAQKEMEEEMLTILSKPSTK